MLIKYSDRYEFNDIWVKNYVSNTKYKTLNGDIKPFINRKYNIVDKGFSI